MKIALRKQAFACFRGILCLGLALLLGLAWGNEAAAGERFVNVPVITKDAQNVGTTRTLVAAIFVEKSPMSVISLNWKEKMLPNPIVMAYSDGTIVWSKDPINGGAPLYKATIEKAKIEDLLRRFKEKGYFENRSLGQIQFGPDASYTSIYIKHGDEILDMRSWHELAEQNPNSVVTSRGIGLLGKRDRAQVLMSDTKEYQDYRTAWSDIKRKLLGLIPKEEVKPSEGLKVKGTQSITIPKKQN